MSTFYSNVNVKGTLTMNSTQILGLAAGSASGHAVEFDQMNTAISAALDDNSVLRYRGTFDATTTALTAPANEAGDFYLISVGGTAYGETFTAGDHLVFSQDVAAAVAPTTSDFDKIDNTESTASLGSLGDVGLDTAAQGDFLGYNGTEWTDYAFASDSFSFTHTDGSEAVEIKLDGTTLSKSASGLKVNSITLAEVSDSGTLAALSELPLADIADIANNTFLGNDSGGAAAPQALTAAEARAVLNVEDGATADQTGAEIKAAYEGEANTNAFTDADESKLDAIEAGAEVNRSVHIELIGTNSAEAINHGFSLADAKAVRIHMVDNSTGEPVFADSVTFTDGDNLTINLVGAPGSDTIKLILESAE